MQVDEIAFCARAMKEHLRSTLLADKSNYEAYVVANPVVNDLLAKAQVLVARRGNRALGFIAWLDVDGIALVHCYTREGERRQGVAQDLLVAAFQHIDPESTLESYFPTHRWAEVATRYGFYTPETL